MMSLFTKIVGNKKEWREMQVRAHALPGEYQLVYSRINSYMWKRTSGAGLDTIAALKDMLSLFETSAARGVDVLDVTGRDVARFCDERLPRATTYLDSWRDSLNRDVAEKLGE